MEHPVDNSRPIVAEYAGVAREGAGSPSVRGEAGARAHWGGSPDQRTANLGAVSRRMFSGESAAAVNPAVNAPGPVRTGPLRKVRLRRPRNGGPADGVSPRDVRTQEGLAGVPGYRIRAHQALCERVYVRP